MSATRPASTSARRAVPLPLLLALLALVAWLPTVRLARFAGDDRELLFENPAVDGALPWTAAFERDYFHHVGDAGQYRPLATLSLRFERAFWERLGLGRSARVYHLGNALLHAAVVLLAALALRRAGLAGACFGLALFAVHPALADAVAWISGRTSIVSALFGCAGAWALVRALDAGRAPLALGIAGCGLAGALGAKEDGVFFALVYLALAARSSGRALAWTAAGCGAALALYFAARDAALGAALPRASEPVLAGAALVERARLGGAAALEALRIAAAPLGYPPQYRASYLLDASPALRGALGWIAWSAAAACALASLRRARARVAACSLAASCCAFLPALQLVPIGEAFAPRFLYLPFLFAAPFVGAAWERIGPRRSVAALAIAALALGAWQRASVYAGRGAYRREVLRFQPSDARSWNELGLALEEEERDLDAARHAWRRAIELDSGYSKPWSNLGRVALEAGKLEEAERDLRRAVECGPRNPTARVNLANFFLRTERFDEAADEYRRAVELAPGFEPAWRGLGNALLASDRRGAAAAALRRALELNPGDARARALLERAEAP